MAAKIRALGYKLYIGNLPWTVGSQQLKEYFSQFGYISKAVVIFDKDTGMSRGFGFVTFSIEDSVRAVNKVPQHILEGYSLKIEPTDKSQ